MKTRRLLVVISASAAVVVAVAAWATVALVGRQGYVAPPMGATFVYAEKNTGSFGDGSREASYRIEPRTWEGKQVFAVVEPNGATIQSLVNGNTIAVLGADGKPTVSLEPPIGFDYPLEVGRTVTRNIKVVHHARGTSLTVVYTFKVEGYETLNVPAGTFKVFKLRTTSVALDTVEWVSPEHGMQPVKRSNIRVQGAIRGVGTREAELISVSTKK